MLVTAAMPRSRARSRPNVGGRRESGETLRFQAAATLADTGMAGQLASNGTLTGGADQIARPPQVSVRIIVIDSLWTSKPTQLLISLYMDGLLAAVADDPVTACGSAQKCATYGSGRRSAPAIACCDHDVYVFSIGPGACRACKWRLGLCPISRLNMATKALAEP